MYKLDIVTTPQMIFTVCTSTLRCRINDIHGLSKYLYISSHGYSYRQRRRSHVSASKVTGYQVFIFIQECTVFTCAVASYPGSSSSSFGVSVYTETTTTRPWVRGYSHACMHACLPSARAHDNHVCSVLVALSIRIPCSHSA